MTPPLLSVITPALNRAQYIEEAIQSVLSQNYPNIEHIVVDGGSTDGTLDILAKYPQLRVLSEPDRGMYDALNKGLKISSGELVGFLNSDDLYAPGGLAAAVAQFTTESVLAVVGRAEIFSIDSDGHRSTIYRFSPQGADLMQLCFGIGAFFNAWLFRRSVFEKIGAFNSAYRIVADTDFMMRLALSELKYDTVNAPVYYYRQHVDTLTFALTTEKLDRILREKLPMTASYLRQRSLPPAARQLIAASRTRDTLELGTRLIRERRFARFIPLAWAGSHYDPVWSFRLLWRALRRTMRWAKRNASRGK